MPSVSWSDDPRRMGGRMILNAILSGILAVLLLSFWYEKHRTTKGQDGAAGLVPNPLMDMFPDIANPVPVPDDGEVISIAPGEAVESVYHVMVSGLSDNMDLALAGMRLIDAGSVRVMLLTPVVDANGIHIKVIVNRPD